MGMFDNLRCEYPLPVEGANDIDYQTKDTDEQYLDNYVIRADGTLWHEEYDIEDHSDPNATGLERIFGCMTRVRERWVQEQTFTGEIRFGANPWAVRARQRVSQVRYQPSTVRFGRRRTKGKS